MPLNKEKEPLLYEDVINVDTYLFSRESLHPLSENLFQVEHGVLFQPPYNWSFLEIQKRNRTILNQTIFLYENEEECEKKKYFRFNEHWINNKK